MLMFAYPRLRFILASLQLQMMSKLKSFKDIQEGLASLPQSLDDYYHRILENTTNQVSTLSDQITKVISWIYRAKRPLLVSELLKAIAVTVDGDNLGTLLGENSREILAMILDRCSGLVVIDEERSVIRFAHFSVQEFLQPGTFKLPGECEIANTCLTFLTLGDSIRGLCKNDRDLDDKLSKYPFLEYAARYWGVHGKYCTNPTFFNLAVKLLCHEGYLASAIQVIDYTDCHSNYYPDSYSKVFTRKLSGLHIVASLGLDQLLESVIGNSHAKIDEVDDQGQTPLIYAAKGGQKSMVELLIQRGARVDVEDKTCRSALS